MSANSFPRQPLQGQIQEQLTVIIPGPPRPQPAPRPMKEKSRLGCVTSPRRQQGPGPQPGSLGSPAGLWGGQGGGSQLPEGSG